MKISKLLLFTVILSSFFITESCRKRKEFKNETGEVSEDLKNVQSGMDAALNDANIAFSNFGKSATSASGHNICGATVDTSQLSSGIIKLIFDGTTNCHGRIRSGELLLTLQNYSSGTRWKDPGAVMNVQMANFRIERSVGNKGITFNGSKTVTNVMGGNAAFLVFGLVDSLVHEVSGNGIIAKFDDASTSTFNISRKYTHTFSNTVYQVKGEGNSTQNGINNIEKWGTTRKGDAFTSQVVKPVIWNNECGAHKPLSGELDINVDSKDFNLYTTLGVDANGNPVSSGCAWGLKVEWKRNNKTGSKLFQYH